MDDLDRVLARLAGAPLPTGLDGIEARVLARISARPVAREASIGIGIVTIAALAIGTAGGMAGAGVPAAASAVSPLAPLGGSSALAPSTLLASTP